MKQAAGPPVLRVVVVIVDGLPVDLADDVVPELPFLGSRLAHHGTAVSCFPSTTGPAYFPFLAGCTPGRANVPGIRWFDRTRPTPSAFPHRGLRSYVGPDARRLSTDTRAVTIFARHAWPVSSPIGKDLPKHGELSRDLVWATGARHPSLGPRGPSYVLEARPGAAQGSRDRLRRVSLRGRARPHLRHRGRPTAGGARGDRPAARPEAGGIRGRDPPLGRPRPDGHSHAPRSPRGRRGTGGHDDRLPLDREAVSACRRVRVGERDGERLSAGRPRLGGAPLGRPLPRARLAPPRDRGDRQRRAPRRAAAHCRAEWPEHHASHGALHRHHTVVPVWSSAALPSRPLRTLDLFALTLELADVSLDEYPESDAARLALGAWQPEVWR